MSHLALLDYLQICKNIQNRWTILQACWREGKKVKRFGETRRIKRIVGVYPQLFEESRCVNHSGKIRAANRLFDAVTEIGPPMEMDYWSDYLEDAASCSIRRPNRIYRIIFTDLGRCFDRTQEKKKREEENVLKILFSKKIQGYILNSKLLIINNNIVKICLIDYKSIIGRIYSNDPVRFFDSAISPCQLLPSTSNYLLLWGRKRVYNV